MSICDSLYFIIIEMWHCTVKKKGPRGVRFEGCYSPRSVMATHKGVELTSCGVGRLR